MGNVNTKNHVITLETLWFEDTKQSFVGLSDSKKLKVIANLIKNMDLYDLSSWKEDIAKHLNIIASKIEGV